MSNPSTPGAKAPASPFNYAAAAKKSKPAPATVSGQDATGYVNGSQSPTIPNAAAVAAAAAAAGPASGSQPTSPVQNKPSVQVDGVRVPPGRVDEVRGAAASDVSFGTAGDKNAKPSSSPAAPPTLDNGAPKAFGSVPAPSNAPEKKMDLHAFFRSGGAPSGSQQQQQQPSAQSGSSPSPVPVPTDQRRSLSTYDPHAQSRSPQPSSSPLAGAGGPLHGAVPHLGNPATAAFIPRQQSIPPPFVPQQSPHQAFSPPNAGFHMPQQGGPYGQQPAFIPGKGPSPSPQNIPNGGAPSNASFAPSSAGSRAGSYVGSPQMGGMAPRPPVQQSRQSFGGPTSPRMPSVGLPGGQPMMYQGYVPQGYAYTPYGYPGAYGQYMPQQGGPAPPSLTNSGTSTPSTGIHTPKPAASTVPTSPSLAHSHAPNTPATPSFHSFSPQTQHASLPGSAAAARGPNPAAPQFTPGGSAAHTTPLRSLAGVAEFKPNFEAPVFSPTPKRSAAIKIVNPKEKAEREAKEKAEREAKEKADRQARGEPEPEPTPEPAPAKEEEDSKAADAAAKEKEQKAAAEEREAKEEKEKAEKARLDAEAAEAKRKVDEEERTKLAKEKEEAKAKAEQEAEAAKPAAVEDIKREDTQTPDSSAPSTPRTEVEGLEVKKSQADAIRAEEAALLAQEKIATESKDPAQALVEARESLNATGSIPSPSAPSTPSTSSAPTFLPAKPVGEPAVTEETNAAAEASTSSAPAAAVPSDAQLEAARSIKNLDDVSYPDSVKGPEAGLNANAEPGKYRYDREFLLQFMAVCTAKPDSLPNLADIGMVGDDGIPARGGSFGGRNRGQMGPPSAPSRSGSSVGSFRSSSAGGVGGGAFGGMGNFGTGGNIGMTSEQRFQASLTRAPSGAFGGGRGSMSRTTSQSGMGGAFTSGGRNKSERGSKRRGGPPGERDESRKPGGHVTGDGFEGATLEPRSETGWAPTVIAGNTVTDPNSVEMVNRKVKALLNKLTLEKFDSISKQILEWANKSVQETDGRILRQVIALIFEKATDEATWSEMYARLCRFLMESVSAEVHDESVKAADGTPVTGGALFRKYLLNRCQEDYEQGWKNKEAAAAAAKSKEADDKAKKDANDAAEKEAKDTGKEPSQEAELLSEEYYAAQKAKRRGLGLVRFIGELYRLSMLTERIMHECIKKLLANTENPEEEDIESLCRLLTTVGKGLDNAKAKQHMDVYFSRMRTIADNPKVTSRMRFMIMDVVDLRASRWQSKQEAAGPKTISQIHAEAQKQAEESARRVASSGGKLPRLGDQLSRPNSRRGQGRGEFGVPQTGADGWTTQPQRPATAGNLSGFGRFRSSASDNAGGISLGPTGAFAAKSKQKKEERPATPSNPFAALMGGDVEEPSAAPAENRPRLQLKPRTKPLEGEEDKEGEDKEEEEEDDDGAIDPNASSMSRSEAERRAKNSVEEFYAVKNISEGVASVEALPKEFRSLLITAIAEAALTKKADAVNMARELFAQVAAKDVLAHDELVNSFEPIFKTLVDTAIDAPGAYGFAASLLLGAGVTAEEVETLKGKMESEEGEEEVEYGRGNFDKAWEKANTA
ncbi:hypothetical protein JCM10908_003980 [Rhodotorula pacifica]|uniref:uncharacterized protein n=1 Tax=Rhodotorula pacifica TaxID=1495444 RepID=UPI0031814C58